MYRCQNHSTTDFAHFTSSSSSVFEELPLDRTEHTLRLWKFQPNSSTIKLDLAVFTKTTCPPYVALSYVWGSFDDTEDIYVNGHSIAITTNLFSFLKELLTEASRTRDQYFWADQISMDQNNIQERDHQVGLMGQIYSGAECVHAYLGHEVDVEAIRLDASDFVLQRITEEIALPDSFDIGLALAYLDLCTRPYWQRLWIMQELYLARQTTFWCGSLIIDCLDFRKKIDWMDSMSVAMARFVTFSGSDRVDTLDFQRIAFETQFKQRIKLLLSDSRDEYTLHAALSTYGRCLCSDPRDKVFGLQALLKPDERVSVDYSRSASEITLQALKNLILSERSHPEWNFANQSVRAKILSMGTVVHETFYDGSQMSIDSLSWGFFSMDFRALAWGFLLSGLPACFDIAQQKASTVFNTKGIWAVTRDLAATKKQLALAFELQDTASREKHYWRKQQDSEHRMRGHQEVQAAFCYCHSCQRLCCLNCGLVRVKCVNVPPELIQDKEPALRCSMGKTSRQLIQMQRERVTMILRQAAARQGFNMFGDFWYHPEEWERSAELFAVPLPSEDAEVRTRRDFAPSRRRGRSLEGDGLENVA